MLTEVTAFAGKKNKRDSDLLDRSTDPLPQRCWIPEITASAKYMTAHFSRCPELSFRPYSYQGKNGKRWILRRMGRVSWARKYKRALAFQSKYSTDTHRARMSNSLKTRYSRLHCDSEPFYLKEINGACTWSEAWIRIPEHLRKLTAQSCTPFAQQWLCVLGCHFLKNNSN